MVSLNPYLRVKTMKTLQSALYLVCSDCLQPIMYGDYSSLDYYYDEKQALEIQIKVEKGISELIAGHGVNANLTIAQADINEFSSSPCECCGSKLTGARHEAVCLYY